MPTRKRERIQVYNQRTETDCIFENLNEGSLEKLGEQYPDGEWLEDAIDDSLKNPPANWLEIAQKPEEEFATREQLDKAFELRQETGLDRKNYNMTQDHIEKLRNVLIPAITNDYPLMDFPVRINLAIALVMRNFAEHSEFFTKPE